MLDKKALQIFSIITGLFFIISGVGKVVNTTAFSYLIHQYGLGYFMILSPVIILAEILIGLCLVLLINPRSNSLYALLLLIIFTLAFAYAHFKHGVNDCGCLGTLQPSNLPPVFSFLRNLLLIIMSIIVWMKYPKEKTDIVKWKKYLLIAAMGVSCFSAGYTFTLPPSFKKTDDKPKFENKVVKSTELDNYIKPSIDSSYLVFCFSYSCPHCWNSIENLRQFIKMKIADSVIVFALGEAKEKQFFYDNFKPDFKIRDLTHDKMIKLTTFYPTAFYIRHDTIKLELHGVLPSPITFKQFYLETNFQ
jgi:uncharacterized membrane protein YphA (DoxX/SURF4 family)